MSNSQICIVIQVIKLMHYDILHVDLLNFTNLVSWFHRNTWPVVLLIC